MIKMQFFSSPYLSSLTKKENQLYRQLMLNQDVNILKKEKPETILRLYLHAIKINDYETSYYFLNPISTKEQYLKEMQNSDTDQFLFKKFRFVNSKFIYTSKDSGYIKVDKNNEFLMFKRDGIWKIEEIPFQ